MHPPRHMPRPRRRPCSGEAARSVRRRTRVRGLYRATVGVQVVDEDGGSRVELVLYLGRLRGEGDVLHPIVGPLTRDERLDDAAQGVRTEQAVWNEHDRAVSMLSPRLPACLAEVGAYV